MKNYDEGSVLAAVARKGVKVTRVNVLNPTLVVPVDGIGIHTWGKIDYLVHHCGYGIIRSSEVKALNKKSDKPASKKGDTSKRERKEHKLTDKTKKNAKRK